MTKSSDADSYHVFVVEDEALIRMMIVEMLEALGHRISGEAGQITQAVQLARTAEFDLAILDVNIGGHLITPIAEIIALRKRPIIFASGYAPGVIPEPFRDRPALRKPFMVEDMQKAIILAMAQSGAAA
jgi:CheY-like chemotaxis protein